MWGFARNNEIIEGFRRKMKLIQYPAYGYKNLKNCRLRTLSNAASSINFH